MKAVGMYLLKLLGLAVMLAGWAFFLAFAFFGVMVLGYTGAPNEPCFRAFCIICGLYLSIVGLIYNIIMGKHIANFVEERLLPPGFFSRGGCPFM